MGIQVRMSRKLLQWFVAVIMVFSVILTGSAQKNDVALAASNGQMVRLVNACPNPAMIAWAQVAGYNHEGKYAVWESSPNNQSVTTNGWWWVGYVKISWRTNRDSYLHLTSANVPRNQPNRDWYPVLLDKWGC